MQTMIDDAQEFFVDFFSETGTPDNVVYFFGAGLGIVVLGWILLNWTR